MSDPYLYNASAEGDLEAVKDLISNGVDVNEHDEVMESYISTIVCFAMHSFAMYNLYLLCIGRRRPSPSWCCYWGSY